MILSKNIFDNINFNGGNISCDGGSILLLSFLKKYNLLSSLNSIPLAIPEECLNILILILLVKLFCVIY